MAVLFMNALLVMVHITYMKVAAISCIRMSLAKALPCTCILLLIIFTFIEGLLRFLFSVLAYCMDMTYCMDRGVGFGFGFGFKLASLQVGKSSTRVEVNATEVANQSKRGNTISEFAKAYACGYFSPTQLDHDKLFPSVGAPDYCVTSL